MFLPVTAGSFLLEIVKDDNMMMLRPTDNGFMVLTYDDKNDDPYHFVDLLTKSAYNSKILLLASSTASSNHEIFMGLLDAVKLFKENNNLDDVNRTHFVPCTKHLNAIGAVRMIDTLTRTEIKDICLDVLYRESEEVG